jgi:hypothetical protein
MFTDSSVHVLWDNFNFKRNVKPKVEDSQAVKNEVSILASQLLKKNKLTSGISFIQ